MNKETYRKRVEKLRKEKSDITKRMSELQDEYIATNKPCEKGDMIRIVLQSGRKVTGEANSFGILGDGNVHVVSYKSDKGMRYISAPNQEVKLVVV